MPKRSSMSFHQVLLQLRSLSLHLRYLRLLLRDRPVYELNQPLSLTQIQQKLALIQGSLKKLDDLINSQLRNPFNQFNKKDYQSLKSAITQLQNITQTILILTEEYQFDPIGVQAYLDQKIDREVQQLQQSFTSQLQDTTAYCAMSRSAPRSRRVMRLPSTAITPS